MLFSEPKIPQSRRRRASARVAACVSVLFSEPKIPQCNPRRARRICDLGFSALQRAENSSISAPRAPRGARHRVSVLFSEPKIPQSIATLRAAGADCCFSALQRAENSSMSRRRRTVTICRGSFSALQRAENSSIRPSHRTGTHTHPFQCSSASRKFLNLVPIARRCPIPCRFSALQRAENSSIEFAANPECRQRRVSVLFSEPKIPQSSYGLCFRSDSDDVSVLFSEPKIPQS